jgi:hypothetical protein
MIKFKTSSSARLSFGAGDDQTGEKIASADSRTIGQVSADCHFRSEIRKREATRLPSSSRRRRSEMQRLAFWAAGQPEAEGEDGSREKEKGEWPDVPRKPAEGDVNDEGDSQARKCQDEHDHNQFDGDGGRTGWLLHSGI